MTDTVRITAGDDAGIAPARRRRMGRAERREQLLDAATEAFAGGDTDSVNIDQVADRAGVSRALVYEYFGDRANLVAEVQRRYRRGLQAMLDEAFAESGAAADELLVAFVSAHLRFAARGAGAYRLATERNDRQIAWLAEYFGGTPEAWVISAAAAQGLRAFALTWAERDAVSVERASELIVGFLSGGLSAIRPLGVRAPVGRQARSATYSTAS